MGIFNFNKNHPFIDEAFIFDKEMKLGTVTAKNLWIQRLDYYIGFYEKLKTQLDSSSTVL